ncbi:MAG: RnfABCDGE type electron transport complex subunit G [Pseudomonadota bacterium]|nr:RnfABCDGE type electron transport complex subunit G [Pseudomonadota bacterium]
MKALLQLQLIVLGFTLLCALVFFLTEANREANQLAFEQQQLSQVAKGDVQSFQRMALNDKQWVYYSLAENQVVLEALSPKGYGGDLRVLVGLDSVGEITGLMVLKPHLETPGLGDKVEAGKSQFLQQFIGKSLENAPEKAWQLSAEGGAFDAVTGATVSSRAVVEAVSAGLAAWTQWLESSSNVVPIKAGEAGDD